VTKREKLDALMPHQGPCLICGGPDKRHRLWDAIEGRHRTGEAVESIVEDYNGGDVSPELILLLRELFDEARRKKQALPGRDRASAVKVR
jgi:hypothetical protein